MQLNSLVEEGEHTRDVQADILEVKKSDAVLLLREAPSEGQLRIPRTTSPSPTFSSKSSILRSISRIAFSRPLL